jgi:hypothetical protein
MVRLGGDAESINYDRGALVELEVNGAEYRLDVGRHGIGLCVSQRVRGHSQWHVLSAARWNGRALRASALDQNIAAHLSAAFARAVEQLG